MTDTIIPEALEEILEEEINFIQTSETGCLYFKKKFGDRLPTPVEFIDAYGAAIHPLIRWLVKNEKDRDLKSCVQRLSKSNDSATSNIIEAIAILKSLLPLDERWIKKFQQDREKLAKNHEKKIKREYEKSEKIILAAAKITDNIDVDKALKDAQRKSEERQPPAYLKSASEALKYGYIWPDKNMKKSSKGSESLRWFICKTYLTAKTQTTASDNSIFVNIATILNVLNVKDDTYFTNKNIQSYVRRHCPK